MPGMELRRKTDQPGPRIKTHVLVWVEEQLHRAPSPGGLPRLRSSALAGVVRSFGRSGPEPA